MHRKQLLAVAQLDGAVDLAPHHQVGAAQAPLAVPASSTEVGFVGGRHRNQGNEDLLPSELI